MRRPVLSLPERRVNAAPGEVTDAVVKALINAEAVPRNGMSNLLGAPLNQKPQEEAE